MAERTRLPIDEQSVTLRMDDYLNGGRAYLIDANGRDNYEGRQFVYDSTVGTRKEAESAANEFNALPNDLGILGEREYVAGVAVDRLGTILTEAIIYEGRKFGTWHTTDLQTFDDLEAVLTEKTGEKRIHQRTEVKGAYGTIN